MVPEPAAILVPENIKLEPDTFVSLFSVSELNAVHP